MQLTTSAGLCCLSVIADTAKDSFGPLLWLGIGAGRCSEGGFRSVVGSVWLYVVGSVWCLLLLGRISPSLPRNWHWVRATAVADVCCGHGSSLLFFKVHELKACLQMVWSWSPPLVLPLSCETVLKGLPLLLSTSACSEGYFCSGENRGMKFPIFFILNPASLWCCTYNGLLKPTHHSKSYFFNMQLLPEG